MATRSELLPEEKKAGWKLLFDGKSLRGWRGYKMKKPPAAWKVVDGAVGDEIAKKSEAKGLIVLGFMQWYWTTEVRSMALPTDDWQYVDGWLKINWTQGIDYFCNCATNSYDSLQAKFNKRFGQGYSAKVNYTWQHVRQRQVRVVEDELAGPEVHGITVVARIARCRPGRTGQPRRRAGAAFTHQLAPVGRGGRGTWRAADPRRRAG